MSLVFARLHRHMVGPCRDACLPVRALALLAVLVALPSAPRAAFVGVNLGGWLVMEDWVLPQYFWDTSPPDERGLIRRKGGNAHPDAVAFMRAHWDAFVTEADVAQMAAFGITHLRIPVGYWLVDWRPEDGFVDGGEAYLRRLLAWLRPRGLKAVLDLHALPGAQTPRQSFTGCVDCYERGQQLWNEPYLSRGKECMRRLAELVVAYEADARTRDVVVGMQPVNEPDHAKWAEVRALYAEMVPALRTILPPAYTLYLNFMNGVDVAAAWMRQQMTAAPATWANVVFDYHIYHSFGDNDHWGPLKASWVAGNTDACKTCCRDALRLRLLRGIPTVVGEWSLTVSTSNEHQHKGAAFLRGFWEQQLSLYASETLGSFFFTWAIPALDNTPEYQVTGRGGGWAGSLYATPPPSPSHR